MPKKKSQAQIDIAPEQFRAIADAQAKEIKKTLQDNRDNPILRSLLGNFAEMDETDTDTFIKRMLSH